MANSKPASAEHVEHLTTISKTKSFLGREFLTWLWYVAETSDERLEVEGDGETYEVEIWVDDRLVLESATAKSHENVLRGGDPSRSAEAQAALMSGKTVKELKLGMHIKPLGDFSCVLSAQDLTPRSLKLPNPNSPENVADPDETPLVQRLKQTDVFLSVLDSLFVRFLKERLDKGWEKTGLDGIRSWIKSRSGDAVLH